MLDLGNHALTLNGTGGGDIRIRHAFQGTGTLIHHRAQNLFLQGTSPAFTGPIQVLGGSLMVEGANSLGSNTATAPITVTDGATLDLQNNFTLTTNRPLHLANGSKLISRAQTTWTGNGDIILDGVALDTDLETSSTSNFLTISGNGSITGNNTTLDVNTAAGSTITIERDITVSGSTIGNTGLRKSGEGTLILSNQADYFATTRVEAGILRLTASERLPAVSRVSVNNTGTFDLDGYTQTSRGLAGSGNVHLGAGNLRLQPTGTVATFTGEISGTGTVEVLSTVREQVFNSPNTYTGPTIVRSGGNLSLQSSNALGPNPALTIESGGSVTVDSAVLRVTSLAGGGSLDLSSPTSKLEIDNSSIVIWDGLVGGPGSLEKIGNFQAIFTNTATHEGTTRVRNGNFEARGGIPNSEVAVDAGASLFAQGVISGASISGLLQPSITNQAAGALTINGPLAFGSGATLNMRFQDWNGSPGTGHSVIECETLSFNSDTTAPVNIIVTLNSSLANFEEAPRSFKLIRTSSGVINNFQMSSNVIINLNNPSSVSPEGTWSLRVLDGDLEAVYTPEGFSGYEAWLAAYDLGLLTGPNDDPDNDGIPNLIEFIIGGNPEDVDDSGKLPTSTVDATHIEFIFRRSKASEYLNSAVRHGIDLVGWDTAMHNEDGVTISNESDPHDPEIDLVTVRIPRNAEPRRFAQLFAALPAEP